MIYSRVKRQDAEKYKGKFVWIGTDGKKYIYSRKLKKFILIGE